MSLKISVEFDTDDSEHISLLQSLLNSSIPSFAASAKNDTKSVNNTVVNNIVEAAQPAETEPEVGGKPEAEDGDEKEPTLSDVRNSLRRFNEATSLDKAKSLLDKFGTKNLSGLDSSKYGEVIAACEEGIAAQEA